MFFRFLLCVCLVIQIIHGKTEEEIRTWFLRQALECNKEHPVSPDEMQMLQKHKLPESKNAKCLLACVFKRANFDLITYSVMRLYSSIRKFWENEYSKVHTLIISVEKDETMKQDLQPLTIRVNDKGMFDVEGATAQAAKDHAGDATKVENSKKLMEICGKINSETVGDGEAGCDRAFLLFKCFSDNAPQLGFPMQQMH